MALRDQAIRQNPGKHQELCTNAIAQALNSTVVFGAWVATFGSWMFVALDLAALCIIRRARRPIRRPRVRKASMIRVRDLAKSYGELQAVDGSLVRGARRARSTACSGPNGAGKTTTLSMISGLLQPGRGTGALRRRRPGRGPAAASRPASASCPQEVALYEELTARENLRFWGGLYGLARREAEARRSTRRSSRSVSTARAKDRGEDVLRRHEAPAEPRAWAWSTGRAWC